MNCCGSNSDSYQKIDLKTKKLEEIKLKINGGILTFDSDVGVFRQSENFNISKNNSINYSIKKVQIEELELMIKSRLEEKSRLINDTKIVCDNIEKITNLLKVDLEDKSFMEEIKDNFQNYKNMISETVYENETKNNTHLTNDNSVNVTIKDKENHNQSGYLDTINNVQSAVTNHDNVKNENFDKENSDFVEEIM